MEIIFTDHAKKRIKERSIMTNHIREAMRAPTLRKPSYYPTEIIQKITSRGILEIIFKKRKTTCIVITLYYL